MEIQDTLLQRHIVDINTYGAKDSIHRYECKILAAGREVPALFVDEFEQNRNYFENYTDVTRIRVAIVAGDYNRYIVPNREEIKVTIKRIPLTPGMSPSESKVRSIKEQTFIGTLYEMNSAMVEGNTMHDANPVKLNDIDFTVVNIRLRDETHENIRKRTVGGIFRDTNGANIIKTILTAVSKEGLNDNETGILGVDIAPGFSTEKREQILIPHMTPLAKFPRVVNEESGGLYPLGFRYYLQDRYWYIFAPFDVNKSDQGKRTLVIVNVPPNRMANPEVSYRLQDRTITILATGKTKFQDLSEDARLNEGAGIRFVDANKILEDYASVENNKAVVKKANNVTEAVNDTIAKDKDNLVSQSSVKITSQYNLQYSTLAARNGALIQTVWEAADISYLYPGMGVKYLYLAGNRVEEKVGILISVNSISRRTNQNQGEARFSQSASLTIFVDRKVKDL